MTKEDFLKIVQSFKEKSIDIKLDTYINMGKCYLRGIIINNKPGNEIKNEIGNGLLKDFKIKKTYLWYLGEKKKAILLKLKDELIMEIPEVERLEINNYA
jgi:hypothetical protein